jgi:hypothetical protein
MDNAGIANGKRDVKGSLVKFFFNMLHEILRF